MGFVVTYLNGTMIIFFSSIMQYAPFEQWCVLSSNAFEADHRIKYKTIRQNEPIVFLVICK